MKSTFWGLVAGLCTIMLLLLLISGLLMISGTIPHDYLLWIEIPVFIIGGYFAGYTAARITKHNALLSGGLCALLMFFTLIFSGFAAGNNLTHVSLIKLLVILLGALAGSIKGVNKKEKLRIK